LPGNSAGETRAVASLPNLDIEIHHRRLQDGDGEQILISLQAKPSFEAFGRFLDASIPLNFWMGMMQVAWSSWLAALPPALPQSYLPSKKK
jgi:hypothetical protein